MPAVLLCVLMKELKTMRANELLRAYRASYSGRAFCGERYSRGRESMREMRVVCLCSMDSEKEAINRNVFFGSQTFHNDAAAEL